MINFLQNKNIEKMEIFSALAIHFVAALTILEMYLIYALDL